MAAMKVQTDEAAKNNHTYNPAITMKRRTIFSIIAGIGILTAPLAGHAQTTGSLDVPRTISYQGVLSSTAGTPLPDGDYDITVRLYADPSGTLPLWQDTYRTNVRGGLFNLYIGGGNSPLPSSAEMNRPLWVGTTVNGMEEMLPLTPLTSSPYALNLPDNAVTTGKLADGAVTAEKVEMPYMAGVRINGQEISGKGTILDIRSGDDIEVRYDQASESLIIDSKSTAKTTNDDKEKGASIQDWMGNSSQNWIGRDAAFGGAVNVPYYDVPNTTTSTYNTLAGGFKTVIRDNSHYNFIGGGRQNAIRGNYNVIGGGGGTSSVVYTSKDTNAIFYSNYGVIGGGRGNLIDSAAHDATIGGGIGNWIQMNAYSDGLITNESGATIGGGGGNVATGYHATIAGGHHNLATGNFAFIGGGGGEPHNVLQTQANQATATYTVVAGGHSNRSTEDYATIGGGARHRASGEYAFIGGGDTNVIYGTYGAIGGGGENFIDSLSSYGFIGGGVHNRIDTNSHFSAIGGGEHNEIGHNSNLNIIGGGLYNVIDSFAQRNFIGGGETNRIMRYNSHSTISGGYTNTINPNWHYGIIGGGSWNKVDATLATIAGGDSNLIGGEYGFIGGGRLNTVNNSWGAISGGDSNLIQNGSDYAAIGGGHLNRIDNNATFATIAGGYTNTVEALEGFIGAGNHNTITAAADHAVIAGGGSNTVQANALYAVIGGGSDNQIQSNSSQATTWATISGGKNNSIGTNGDYTTISGGVNNSGTGSYSVIGGGDEHLASALNSTIAGGWNNTASNSFATVGGGKQNIASGNSSVIPGGDHLQTPNFAQSAVGFYNASRGTITSRPNSAALAAIKDPLFMVGNGPSGGSRQNAFEVSYNGHSVVYDLNGSGTTNAAIRGATYTDNVIYAWGTATPTPGTVTVNCDFGVLNIMWMGIGHYKVTINPVNPDGTPMILSCGSVTATLATQNRECAFINATPLNNNQFDVFISAPGISKIYGPGGTLMDVFPTCGEIDLPFAFKVTARPPTEY